MRAVALGVSGRTWVATLALLCGGLCACDVARAQDDAPDRTPETTAPMRYEGAYRSRPRGVLGRGLSNWAQRRRGPVVNVLAAIGNPLGRRLPETRSQWRFRNVPTTSEAQVLTTTKSRRTPPQATLSGQVVHEGEHVYVLSGQDKVLVEGPASEELKKLAGQQVRVSGMLTVNDQGAMVMHGKRSETVDPTIRPAAAKAPMPESIPGGMGTSAGPSS